MKSNVLWQRWTAWNGSFLVISILLHVLLLGGATMLVVQVVQNRKERLKFTAPPPSPAGMVEHKVKPSKKTAAAAPAISKRITTTALNTSIALPSVDLNSSGPDMMASVMSGMGGTGLGSGAGGGVAGMASMPVAGLTAFGFKGGGGGGLKGYLYDFKQTADKKPTAVATAADQDAAGTEQMKIFEEFFSNGWDDKVFDRYYKAKDPMVTYQVYIPYMDAAAAPKAFGVEKEIKPSRWAIVYKGSVTASSDGRFRFRGLADDVIAVRFNNENVMLEGIGIGSLRHIFIQPGVKPAPGEPCSRWFSVESGKTYPIEVLISEVPGGFFAAFLQIEEKYKTYPKGTDPGNKNTIYPLFQTKKGVPIPTRLPESPEWWKNPKGVAPELAPEPVIFNSK